MESLASLGKKIIPKKLFSALQPVYHFTLALIGAILYRFPSRYYIKVVAITGTKGKSSVAELVNAILEEAGFRTAVLDTIRFKIGENSRPNLYKMTTPGRFFVQKFLRQAVKESCDWAILEMTSEAARQFRHKFISLDAFIFTNLSPEHIESHGSYEKYVQAKLSIGKALEQSSKKDKVLIVNADEKEAARFLALSVPQKFTYSLKAIPDYRVANGGTSFTFAGEKINPKLEGVFNIYNCLAAATFAKSQNISPKVIKSALEKVTIIKGRVEHIDCGQNFTVIVDYAHTPDSLEKLYQAFPNRRKIAVLGNTGGGRDKWKRPEMGKIADQYCDQIILTNEDPYDEDPRAILADMEKGFTKHKPEVILDRRQAISAALRKAWRDDIVLITGKGTDPYIMEANGKKVPWSDEGVVKEELRKLKI
ncbi:MAG: UDP-N-acetylmuramoyl-L-alanyl-D-glutamate-2,6-diaminopimelate ligase [candidate division CPR1 bacterium GW2011_GWA2_42_17]|uniref:UDP-N-acetylmuramoyl-L-alanyl-D-glutamate-2, 6-diaminopimelate ligase n=1 Tax=candidate division CPR1 bacterium GW2011_GWA2_42_17 TaxID=1618341 RepID=A0A0G0Z4F8_9BACT|nr:MAG: UDP-N-acetylmuramoyl-L-alanyl-D-glutamate-2,6-diaminopimelate ligase [candidate division CPR1 bacterium GW2011_GWA2_42_17]